MQIQFSTDYDSFQLITENRNISELHVRNLEEDPSFKNSFQFHPIIVDEKRRIIDGQHRFKAAQKIGLPIYFICQPGANLDTIRRYNVQQRPWTERDYLAFYVKQRKPDYIYVEAACKAYHWTLGAILDIVSKLNNESRHILLDDFRNGKLKIKNKEYISEFLSRLEIGFEKLRAHHKAEEYRHVMCQAYIKAYCEYYQNNEKQFNKFMEKLYMVFNSMPLTNKVQEAYEYLCKAATKKLRYY